MNTSTNKTAMSRIPKSKELAEVKLDPTLVSLRAYEIYQRRQGDGAAGDAISDWLQAERELAGTKGANAGQRM